MTGGLRLGFESIGDDEEVEMSFCRCATLHGFVVRVHVRVVVYIESGRSEVFRDLSMVRRVLEMGRRRNTTLARTMSSIGVLDADMVRARFERGEKVVRSIEQACAHR